MANVVKSGFVALLSNSYYLLVNFGLNHSFPLNIQGGWLTKVLDFA